MCGAMTRGPMGRGDVRGWRRSGPSVDRLRSRVAVTQGKQRADWPMQTRLWKCQARKEMPGGHDSVDRSTRVDRLDRRPKFPRYPAKADFGLLYKSQ